MRRMRIFPPMRARWRCRASTITAMPRAATPTAELRLRMQKTMQDDAAVFRTGETLAKG